MDTYTRFPQPHSAHHVHGAAGPYSPQHSTNGGPGGGGGVSPHIAGANMSSSVNQHSPSLPQHHQQYYHHSYPSIPPGAGGPYYNISSSDGMALQVGGGGQKKLSQVKRPGKGEARTDATEIAADVDGWFDARGTDTTARVTVFKSANFRKSGHAEHTTSSGSAENEPTAWRCCWKSIDASLTADEYHSADYSITALNTPTATGTASAATTTPTHTSTVSSTITGHRSRRRDTIICQCKTVSSDFEAPSSEAEARGSSSFDVKATETLLA